MSLAALLTALRDRGVTLASEGDRLRYHAPPGALTRHLLDLMRSHRATLLCLVRVVELFDGEVVEVRPSRLDPCHACQGPRGRGYQSRDVSE